jgi:hypothetical protein
MSKDLCRAFEFQVGGDYHGASEIAAGAELEQGLASRGTEGDKVNPVMNDKVVSRELLLKPAQVLLCLCLAEFVDQPGGGAEPDFEALLTGQET